MKTFILALIFTTSAFADCPNNVQKVSQGTPAPCSGWLVSPDTMQKMSKTDEELEISKKLILAQEHLQKLSEAEIDYYKQKSKSQQKELDKAETKQFLTGVGAFALGVIVTGLAAKVAIEATR